MVAPAPDVKPKPVTEAVEKPVEKSSTRKPSTGAEVRSGAARVETPNAAQVPFGGLAERAGATSAGGPRLDVANFCCPEYVDTMSQRIRSNWDQKQGAAGQTIVKFTIRRDGMLANVEVEKTSGNPLLDLESKRAVINTRQLPAASGSVRPTDTDGVSDIRLHALMRSMKLLTTVLIASARDGCSPPRTHPRHRRKRQQPGSIGLLISGRDDGTPPKLAVPEFIPLGKEPEVIAAAKTIADVLWDDLAYEKEFYLLPRDILRTVPRPASAEQVTMDRWKELGAEGLVVGTVRKTADGIVVEARLMRVMNGAHDARQAVQRLAAVADRRRPRLRSRHRRRDPQAAAQPARRGPDQARVFVRP